MNDTAWIAKAAKQPIGLEPVDLGLLGDEDVEVTVDHSGLCHFDLSVLNNDWGLSQYPATFGHEVIGRVSNMGPNAKGLKFGQRVGVGWNSGNCTHCHQCMSGNHPLCSQVQPTILGHRGGFAPHIRSHWAWAIPLSDNLNVAEPGPFLWVGDHRLCAVGEVRQADRIIGLSGLGHMAVKFAAALWRDMTAFTSSERTFDDPKRFGANHVGTIKDSAAIKKLGGRFDLLISTVNVTLDWDVMIGTLTSNGRLHALCAVLEPIPVGAFSLIMQERSVSVSPTGSPPAIETMLDFAALLGHPQPHIGKIYHLTRPQSDNMNFYAQEYSKGLGRTITFQGIPVKQCGMGCFERGLPVHLVNHLATMADLHCAGRYDRMSDDVLTLTGQGSLTVQEFVRTNAATFTASAKEAI